jgi:restriction system protein
MRADLTYHFPPELFGLLIEVIPLLNPRKRDVVVFFRGAGVPKEMTDVLAQKLRDAPNDINKYEMTRVVLDRLNARGEPLLAVRREVLRRVVEFTTFDACWPDDQLKAKGLVASIRDVVNQKDAFTRMAQERDHERQARLAQAEALAKERRQRITKIASAKAEFYALFSAQLSPQARGKLLEAALNNLFAAYGILVREAFHLVGQEGEGIVEQIDGVIELKGALYFVEMKWYTNPVGVAEISPHLVRLMGRAQARGIVISASKFTDPAILMAREFLQQKVVVLATLEELVRVLDQQDELSEFWDKKVQAAQMYKSPYFNPFEVG